MPFWNKKAKDPEPETAPAPPPLPPAAAVITPESAWTTQIPPTSFDERTWSAYAPPPPAPVPPTISRAAAQAAAVLTQEPPPVVQVQAVSAPIPTVDIADAYTFDGILDEVDEEPEETNSQKVGRLTGELEVTQLQAMAMEQRTRRLEGCLTGVMVFLETELPEHVWAQLEEFARYCEEHMGDMDTMLRSYRKQRDTSEPASVTALKADIELELAELRESGAWR